MTTPAEEQKTRFWSLLTKVLFIFLLAILLPVIIFVMPTASHAKARLFSNVFLLPVFYLLLVRFLCARRSNDKAFLDKDYKWFNLSTAIVLNAFFMLAYLLLFKSAAFLILGAIGLVWYLVFDQTLRGKTKKADRFGISMYSFLATLFAQGLSITFWLFYFFGTDTIRLATIVGFTLALGLDVIEALISRRWQPQPEGEIPASAGGRKKTAEPQTTPANEENTE